MGWYREHVVPRLVDVACGRKTARDIRARVVPALAGDVVELGFGTGHNAPYYPPAVTRVRAVEPSEVARRLAARRVSAATVPVEFAGLDGEHLPFDDDSVDAVLSTWTLCTIPDADQALREVHRVLRPGGRFHFAEHGLAPDPGVVRWQQRLDGIQARVAGGCHLNRPIDRLVEGAGLTVERLDRYYAAGEPKPWGATYEGVAVKNGG